MIAPAEPHPNTVAQKLIGRPYLSHSAISTYQTCPLRYFYRYVSGLPEETVSASLVFGGAIHKAYVDLAVMWNCRFRARFSR